LKKIHSIDIGDCPLESNPDLLLKIAKQRIDLGLIDNKNFDPRWKDKTPEELFKIVEEMKPSSFDLVFTHGDYCLPNILVHKKKLSGFIDWIYGGINDRNYDIAAVTWSIGYNFGEEWVPLFLDEYGTDKIDWSKVEYFQMLNSFIF
jgi:aminoglycoside phosphotransferase